MIDTITPYLPHLACAFVGFLLGFGVLAVFCVNKGDYDDGFADGVRFRQFGDEA
jgi:hypothetical protein